MADGTAGRGAAGIGLGGILVIIGIIVAIVWSLWLGIVIALIGLVAFGGFARGRWYSARCSRRPQPARGPRRTARARRGARVSRRGSNRSSSMYGVGSQRRPGKSKRGVSDALARGRPPAEGC